MQFWILKLIRKWRNDNRERTEQSNLNIWLASDPTAYFRCESRLLRWINLITKNQITPRLFFYHLLHVQKYFSQGQIRTNLIIIKLVPTLLFVFAYHVSLKRPLVVNQTFQSHPFDWFAFLVSHAEIIIRE